MTTQKIDLSKNMGKEKITIDTILGQLKEWVENKIPISPTVWLDAAIKLNALKQNETELLHKMQQMVAQTKLTLLKDSKSVAEVKIKVEATDVYRFMKDQEEKIDMVEEQIRISKIQARLSENQMYNQ